MERKYPEIAINYEENREGKFVFISDSEDEEEEEEQKYFETIINEKTAVPLLNYEEESEKEESETEESETEEESETN